MANDNLRKIIHNAGLRQWEVAELLNISEFHFCRKLRRELPEEEQKKIISAIADATEGGR